MKVTVIRDPKGNVIAALGSGPLRLADGCQVSPVVLLQPGQTSYEVEIADNPKGAGLLNAVQHLDLK